MDSKLAPLVSVIIPVYNAEKYIGSLLENLERQTYHNVELLFVDDGSTDGTYNRLMQSSKCENRIQVLHKENGGPSSARNYGLSVCTGELILFLDADDEIEEEYIGNLVEAIKGNQLAIASMKKKYIKEETVYKIETDRVKIKNGKYSLKKIFVDSLKDNYIWSISACNKMYRADIIKKYDLSFNEKIKWSEDLLWNSKYFLHVDNVGVNNNSAYVYCMRGLDSSITKKFDEKNIWDYIVAASELVTYIEEKDIEKNDDAYMWIIRMLVSNLANIYRKDWDIDKRKEFVISAIQHQSIKKSLINARANTITDYIILDLVKSNNVYMLLGICYFIHVLRDCKN